MTEEVVNQEAPAEAPTESTPVESVETPSDLDQANSEVQKSMADATTETESKTDSTDEVSADETTEVEEAPQGKAEDRKQQLNTEIRDLVSQRNALREQVQLANSQVYQPATEGELLDQVNPETGENYNRLEAKLAAMEQAQEVERYNTQVAEAQLTLTSEAQAALRDFPMFDSESPEYKPEIAAQVDQLLAKQIILDPNTGQIVGSNVSPYELYKTIATASQVSSVKGQLEGQKATEKMQSRVDSASNAAPAKSTENDDFLKGLRG